MRTSAPARRALPSVEGVLAIVAHPDDESFGLGAVLSKLVALGAVADLICFTHGEASTLGDGRLRETRAAELSSAAKQLGLRSALLLDYPDGGLTDVPLEALVADIDRQIDQRQPDLLLVFDEGGVTGHADHRAATHAAIVASGGRPVLAWTLSEVVAEGLNEEFRTAFVGRALGDVDFMVDVDRARQTKAIRCHVSQSIENPVVWRRLERQGATECLRWLRSPSDDPVRERASDRARTETTVEDVVELA